MNGGASRASFSRVKLLLVDVFSGGGGYRGRVKVMIAANIMYRAALPKGTCGDETLCRAKTGNENESEIMEWLGGKNNGPGMNIRERHETRMRAVGVGGGGGWSDCGGACGFSI